MSQPYDPNEQYRQGVPRPRSPEDLAAGEPPARPGASLPPGAPRPREQDEWVDEPAGPRLGSLAQSARAKQLNQARWLLIVIGVITLGANAFFAATARSQVDTEIQNQQRKAAAAGQMLIIDHARVDTVVRLIVIASIVMCLVGALFIVFGIIVKMYPVPITITSLVLYVVAALIFAVIDPQTLLQGIIIKIFIVIALISSVKAAFAYEREGALEGQGG